MRVTNFDTAGIPGETKGLSTAPKYTITWSWKIQLGLQRPRLLCLIQPWDFRPYLPNNATSAISLLLATL